ncbi:hypothetical protein Synpcc7942_0389 [Synechococcus elongatus PCC 7942 = FACHB-805]|uniref:Uncharacterized protein n=1 Tax=Synechococcus elongatus (strain ATCC 33912 / PCC 7942 / FACHB-805) TaxID=1140 RepID=Q31R98_SYNE7|nr:hypothetical protein Synpcc7942_0389 [Synechococcus elongatus PCC 7942 = FACHB-805]
MHAVIYPVAWNSGYPWLPLGGNQWWGCLANFGFRASPATDRSILAVKVRDRCCRSDGDRFTGGNDPPLTHDRHPLKQWTNYKP